LASIKAAPALSETQSTHRQKPEFSGFFLILSLLVARVSFDSKRPRRNQTGGVQSYSGLLDVALGGSGLFEKPARINRFGGF
jgi:hypothetical protein